MRQSADGADCGGAHSKNAHSWPAVDVTSARRVAERGVGAEGSILRQRTENRSGRPQRAARSVLPCVWLVRERASTGVRGLRRDL